MAENDAAIEAFATRFYPSDSIEAQKLRDAARAMGLFLPLTESQRAELANRPPELDELLNAIAGEITPPPA